MPPKKIKFKVVKKLPAKEKPVEKKKPKFKVVKKLNPKEEPESLGKKQTGLTKEEMNKLSPLELFGKLPVELRKKALTSGTKVGKQLNTVKKWQKKLDSLEKKGFEFYVIDNKGTLKKNTGGVKLYKGTRRPYLNSVMADVDYREGRATFSLEVSFWNDNVKEEYPLLKFDMEKTPLGRIRKKVKEKGENTYGSNLIMLKNGPN